MSGRNLTPSPARALHGQLAFTERPHEHPNGLPGAPPEKDEADSGPGGSSNDTDNSGDGNLRLDRSNHAGPIGGTNNGRSSLWNLPLS